MLFYPFFCSTAILNLLFQLFIRFFPPNQVLSIEEMIQLNFLKIYTRGFLQVVLMFVTVDRFWLFHEKSRFVLGYFVLRPGLFRIILGCFRSFRFISACFGSFWVFPPFNSNQAIIIHSNFISKTKFFLHRAKQGVIYCK